MQAGDADERVDTIAEIIIPATDTLGASAANRNRFTDAMLTGSGPAENRNRFLTGLKDTDAPCRNEYGSRFVACSPEQQRALPEPLDAKTFGPDASEPDLGATRALETTLVPGRYDGDVPHGDIGRAWA